MPKVHTPCAPDMARRAEAWLRWGHPAEDVTAALVQEGFPHDLAANTVAAVAFEVRREQARRGRWFLLAGATVTGACAAASLLVTREALLFGIQAVTVEPWRPAARPRRQPKAAGLP